MSKIYPGRYTAIAEEPYVVFLIGMRINKFWALRKWLPVAAAMGPMLTTLYTHPEKGFLGGHNFFGGRTTLLMSYWRSFEDLEHFARHPADPHLGAWKRFNQAVGADGSVGVWHETYQVQPGGYEAIYSNMPRFGLGGVFEHVAVSRRWDTARGRLASSEG